MTGITVGTSTVRSDRSTDKASNGRDGFVLVAVLAGIFVMSVLAISITTTMQTELKARSNLVAKLRAQLIADGLTRYAITQATSDGSVRIGQTPSRSGETVFCKLDDHIAAIRVTAVTGLVDINSAPRALLRTLIQGLGEPPERAAEIAEAIVDFRDANDEPMPNGAERGAYIEAGYGHGPKNGQFDYTFEIDQVLGMTMELRQRIEPFITVDALQPAVDLEAAPPELVYFLGEDVSKFVGQRAPISTNSIDIRTVAWAVDRRVPAGRRATVRMPPSAIRDEELLEWQIIEAVKATPAESNEMIATSCLGARD